MDTEAFRNSGWLYKNGGAKLLTAGIADKLNMHSVKHRLLCDLGFEKCRSDSRLRLIYLPAKEISYYLYLGFIPRGGKHGLCGQPSGNWHKCRKKFREHELFLSIKSHFKDGADWEKTPRFESKWKLIDEHERKRTMNSVDKLYYRIQDHGYKSQTELYDDYGGNRREYQFRVGDLLLPDEILISIGKSGEIIRTKRGKHRLSIMKLLEPNKPIPAIIQFEHSDFEGELPYDEYILNKTHPLVEKAE